MKLFQASFTTLIIRFYLLMLIIIAAGFSGYWMIGLLALPVFFSALMGMQFNPRKTVQKTLPATQQDVRHALNQDSARA